MFLISLPIFFIILAGYLFKRFKIINNEWVHILNGFAYYVSLPAFIIVSLWSIDFWQKDIWGTALFSLAAIFVFSLLVFVILYFLKIRPTLKVAIFLSTTLGNTIYMGAPVIEFGLGKESVAKGALVAVVFLLVPLIISTLIIKYWHDRKHSISKQFLNFLKDPFVISAILGILLSFVGFNFPIVKQIKAAFFMLALTASPVALFALGGFLESKFLKKDLGLVLTISFIKIIAFPFLIFIFFWHRVEIGDFGIYALLSAMPVAVSAFVIAEEFNLEKDMIANAILFSTIISFVVIPIILLLI